MRYVVIPIPANAPRISMVTKILGDPFIHVNLQVLIRDKFIMEET
jgi:hypothetical protein